MVRSRYKEKSTPSGNAFEAELTKHADQAIRQPQPLFDERHEVMTVPLPAYDQGRLLHEERVDVVEVEPCADRHIDQSPLSGADRGVAPEVVEEVTPPVEKVPSGDRSLVDRREPFDLHPGPQGIQTGSGTDRSPSGTVRRWASSL